MVIQKTRIKPRNLVACSPLMKKGGAHQKSQSALRSQKRQQMLSQLEDWQDDLAFERELKQIITYPDDSDAFFFLEPKKPLCNLNTLSKPCIHDFCQTKH